MDNILTEERFDFISNDHKAFILAFNNEMTQLGYDFGDKIGDGYCWGKYMMIYRKSGVRSKNVFARMYIREASIVLRLFLNQVDKHREFIENAPAYIKDVFVGDDGKCKHCHDDQDGACRFRKTYTLDDQLIEKCNGITFEFHNPSLQKINDYIALFSEFYPRKKAR